LGFTLEALDGLWLGDIGPVLFDGVRLGRTGLEGVRLGRIGLDGVRLGRMRPVLSDEPGLGRTGLDGVRLGRMRLVLSDEPGLGRTGLDGVRLDRIGLDGVRLGRICLVLFDGELDVGVNSKSSSDDGLLQFLSSEPSRQSTLPLQRLFLRTHCPF